MNLKPATRGPEGQRFPEPKLPERLVHTCLNHNVLPTAFLLVVQVAFQKMSLFAKRQPPGPGWRFPPYTFRRSYRVSTSRYGTGQMSNSNKTPLGLHRIAEKFGGGHPVGTRFESRKAVDRTRQRHMQAAIAHRILWLEGLQPGFNRGEDVDTYARYIYMHGFSDEMSLGRPISLGCIHVAAADLIPLYDLLPVGTLIWIAEI